MRENNNRKSKKGIGAFTVIIIICAIAVAVFLIKKPAKKADETKNTNENNGNNEIVRTESNGEVKVNRSAKLNEDKTFDGLSITNIHLQSKGGLTTLTGTVTNTSDETKGEYPAKVVFIDENGEDMQTMGIYIKELAPGESTPLNASITFDYTDANDFRIEK